MRRTALCLSLALSLLIPVALDAQARVTVVHGISGSALGLPADLPVDAWVNGVPFLTAFQFTDRCTRYNSARAETACPHLVCPTMEEP